MICPDCNREFQPHPNAIATTIRCRDCNGGRTTKGHDYPQPSAFVQAALLEIALRDPTPLEQIQIAQHIAAMQRHIDREPRFHRRFDQLPKENVCDKYQDSRYVEHVVGYHGRVREPIR